MSYKVKEVAQMVGISVRTLHYYDQIGLLKPRSISPAGYRLYSEDNLERLQQILFFKELDFNLKEIREILENPDFDRNQALKAHREFLMKKKERLSKIIETVEKTINSIEGGIEMNKKEMFNGFDMSEIEKHKEKYAKETKEMYGSSDAYKESEEKTSAYTKEDWQEIQSKGSAIFSKLASLMDKSPEDPEVQETIAAYRQYITDSFYTCTAEIFRGLGNMYVYDERFTKNIDKFGKGLSVFMREAMTIYCDNLEK